MLQLAHIAGPAVVQQSRLRSGLQPQAAQLEPRAVLFEKIAGQLQHIAVALAQRRHIERVDVESVIKVRAHAPGADFRRQIAVGGRNHAHIHMVLPVRAQALQLPALQHTQQLGLHGQRKLTHFIEKQRALMRLLELAAALGQCAGKGTAHMAEQLAFHQVVGQGRTVDADHGLARAP